MLATPLGQGTVRPAGRFCGSARWSRVPWELPQIFQVADELFRRSLNQTFWAEPRIVIGGASFAGFAHVLFPKRSSAGGCPPLYVRPASRISISSSGDMSRRSIFTSLTAGGSNVSGEVLCGRVTRAGRYSNHA